MAYLGSKPANVLTDVSVSLDGLTDVTVTTPSTDQVLQYNGSAWVNATPAASVTNLDSLTDVAITSPTTDQILKYNGSGWVNGAAAGGGVTSAVAGNGIAVSGATGAVTFSAACPTFNTVGSYCFVAQTSGGVSSGSNYSAGNLQSASLYNQEGLAGLNYQNNLSGTWKWMGANNAGSGPYFAVACRVS